MGEWTVITVIIAIVGLFMTVGKPIINLNNNITALNINIKRNTDELAEQKKELKEQKQAAHDSHEKLWAKNDEQDEKIQKHEMRIGILEEKL